MNLTSSSHSKAALEVSVEAVKVRVSVHGGIDSQGGNIRFCDLIDALLACAVSERRRCSDKLQELKETLTLVVIIFIRCLRAQSQKGNAALMSCRR